MLRRLIFFVVLAPLTTLAVSLFLSGSGSVSSDPGLAPGEFWRLPWRADASHNIDGGNGYGQNTHQDADYWALDFQVPQNDYVMAAQEGTVRFTSDNDPHYGIFVDITDVAGYVHRYAIC